MIITSGVFQVSRNIRYSQHSLVIMLVLDLQKKCFLSLLKGVFQKEFTNLQFLRRLLHLYIMSIQKHKFF